LTAPLADATPAIRVLAAINQRTANNVSHVVRPEDSLASIAEYYTADPNAWAHLRDVNGLTSPPQPGQRLILPAGWAGHFGNVTLSAAQLQTHMRTPHRQDEMPVAHKMRLHRQPSGLGSAAQLSLGGDGPVTPAALGYMAAQWAAQIERAGVQGFSLVVRQAGAAVSDIPYGTARGPEANDPQAWSSNTRMMIASVSKFITAIGVLQMLNVNGLNPSEAVYQWLPNYWLYKNGYTVEELQFSDLLRHQSGFSCILETLGLNNAPLSPFEQTKAIIQSNLLDESSFGSVNPSALWCYDNTNYVLIRVLMAVMLGDTQLLETSTEDSLWDAVTVESYQLYINAFVLTPSGVPNAQLMSTSNSALAYLQGTGFSGVDTGADTGSAGASCWYLSANEVLNVANAFRRRNLLDPFNFDNPPQDPTGWFSPQNVLAKLYGMDFAFTVGGSGTCHDGTGFIYYGKNGSVPYQMVWPDGDDSGYWTAVNANIWFFPNDVEVTLLVNSRIGPAEFPSKDEATNLGQYDPRTLLNGLVLQYFPRPQPGLQWCAINNAPCPSC
jgi:hypothetical protein